jgi:hypothetical protein
MELSIPQVLSSRCPPSTYVAVIRQNSVTSYITNTVLPLKYFIIHLNQIHSPWRWRQYIPATRWNRPWLHGMNTPRIITWIAIKTCINISRTQDCLVSGLINCLMFGDYEQLFLMQPLCSFLNIRWSVICHHPNLLELIRIFVKWLHLYSILKLFFFATLYKLCCPNIHCSWQKFKAC